MTIFIELTNYDGHRYDGAKVKINIDEIQSYENSRTENCGYITLKNREAFRVLEPVATIDSLIEKAKVVEYEKRPRVPSGFGGSLVAR